MEQSLTGITGKGKTPKPRLSVFFFVLGDLIIYYFTGIKVEMLIFLTFRRSLRSLN